MHIIMADLFIARTEECATIAGLFTMGGSQRQGPLLCRLEIRFCRLLCRGEQYGATNEQYTHTACQHTELTKHHTPFTFSYTVSSE